ncbi:hypothetical protein [Phaeovulum sp.]
MVTIQPVAKDEREDWQRLLRPTRSYATADAVWGWSHDCENPF